MITFGAPLFLAAGAALATGVAALHFLAPRPPDPAALPTARFLRPDARDEVRWHRRPLDPLVLVLRMTVALLLGAVFAAPRWVPDRSEGVTRIVLLDAGSAMADSWASAVDAASSETAAADGPVRTAVFDASAWQAVDADAWADLPAPGSDAAGSDGDAAGADGSYLNALRALRALASTASTTEVEAVLVTRPRWGAWDAPLAALRSPGWPGTLRIVEVDAPAEPSVTPPSAAAAPAAASPAPGVRLPAGTPDAVVAALQVLGYDPEADRAALAWVDASEADASATARERAADGDTVVVVGPSGADLPADGLWTGGDWPAGPVRAVRTGGASPGMAVSDMELPTGRAAASSTGRMLPVVADDGRPLAAAAPTGAGCVVRYGVPLTAGAGDPGYPALLRALADGCRVTPRPRPAALDGAARTVLEGSGADRVATAALDPRAGTPLEAWVLLALAAVAALESLVVARAGPVLRRAA
ncbi:MAG: BatA domain-containing protein [Longimicrobiales bacterium]